MKKEKQAKIERISEYIGNIKERITINIQSFQCVTSWETDFGTTRIYKIVDKDGNIFTWKTGNTIDEDAEIIVGTVKAHNEYKGVKQTEITRCKIVAWTGAIAPPNAADGRSQARENAEWANFENWIYPAAA